MRLASISALSSAARPSLFVEMAQGSPVPWCFRESVSLLRLWAPVVLSMCYQASSSYSSRGAGRGTTIRGATIEEVSAATVARGFFGDFLLDFALFPHLVSSVSRNFSGISTTTRFLPRNYGIRVGHSTLTLGVVSPRVRGSVFANGHRPFVFRGVLWGFMFFRNRIAFLATTYCGILKVIGGGLARLCCVLSIVGEASTRSYASS